MGISYNPRIVTDGLVLALDAGNTKSYRGSGTSWTDLSGRGNTGTLTNGPTYSSANGGSIVFDGTNDLVNLGATTLSSTLSSLTINLFAKISKINSKQALISSYTSSPQQGGWGVELLLNNTINFFGFSNTTTFTDIQTNLTFSLDQLVNITCVYESSIFSIYINGTLNTSKSGVSTIYKTSNVHIGNGNITVPSIPFQGNIAQVSIYNRALTASEIQQNYNATKSRYQ